MSGVKYNGSDVSVAKTSSSVDCVFCSEPDDDALYMLFNKRLTSDESDTTTTVDGSRSYVKVVSVDVSTYDDNVVEWPMISNMNVMLLEPLG